MLPAYDVQTHCAINVMPQFLPCPHFFTDNVPRILHNPFAVKHDPPSIYQIQPHLFFCLPSASSFFCDHSLQGGTPQRDSLAAACPCRNGRYFLVSAGYPAKTVQNTRTGQHIGHISLSHAWDRQSASLVCLSLIILESPSPLPGTEHKIKPETLAGEAHC